MRYRIPGVAILPGLLALAACWARIGADGSRAGADACRVPRVRLEAEISLLSALTPGLPRTELERRARHNLVDQELMLAEAMRRGLAGRSWRVRRAAVALLIEQEVLARVRPQDLTRPELEDEYRLRREELMRPVMLKYSLLRLICGTGTDLPSHRPGTDFEAWAREAARQLPGAWFFLAGGFESATRVASQLGAEVARQALLLRPREVCGPIAVGQTRYWLQLRDKQPSYLPTFEQAEAVLRSRVADRRRQEALDRLLADLRARAVVVSLDR